MFVLRLFENLNNEVVLQSNLELLEKSYRILIIVKTKEWKATANCRMSIRIKTVIPIDLNKINGFKRREASLSGQVRRTP